MEEATDAELIDGSKRGDAESMEVLYRRHRDWAYRLAWGFLRNQQDAEEVTQDVFRQFFAKIDRFAMRSKLTTYLYVMIKNRSIDLIRRRRPTETLAFDPVAPELRNQEGEEQDLLAMVSGLPDKQREVVILRFGEGLKLEEIADRLDIALGTVKSRLHHALLALRKHLNEQ